MKKLLILIGFLIFLGGCSQVIQQEEEFGAAEFITAPENNTFKIGARNYDIDFKDDITADRPLQYKLDDKFISFKPSGIYFDNRKVLDARQVAKLTDEVTYEGVFGTGIDLGVRFSDRVWSKVIRIDNANVFGLIPQGVQEIIIEFEIETNFVIDGWDKKSDLEIIDKIRLGDFSYIEQASVWDSFEKKICSPDDPDLCDTETNRIKIKTVLSARNDKFYLSKHLTVDWFKSAQHPSWTDVDVTYGTSSQFEVNETTHVFVIEVDTDKFFLCYQDADDTDVDCRAGTVSGTTITYGTLKQFDNTPHATNAGKITCVAKLETDKAMVIWKGDANLLEAIVATTSGTTINFNSGDIETNFSASGLGVTSTNGNNVCDALDTNKVVTAFRRISTDVGLSFVSTVNSGSSGSTITIGTQVQFESGEIKWPAVCDLSTDEGTFAIVYEDQADSDQGKIVIATSTATTINGFTTPQTFPTTPDNDIFEHCENLATDKAVITWRDLVPTPDDLNARIFTIDDEENVTFGTEVTLAGTPVSHNTARSIDSERFLAAHQDDDSTDDGTSILSSFSGTTITAGSGEVFDSGAVGGGFADFAVSLALISTDKVIICYQLDSGTDDPGHCIVGDVSALAAVGNATDGDFVCKSGVCQFKSGTSQIK